jgi:hypothetical protein
MKNLHEIEFIEVLAKLPNIKEFNVNHDLCNVTDDIFLCALGFEDRCPWIAELLSEKGNYKSKSSFCFQYTTNITDNKINETRLLGALNNFSDSVEPLDCDDEGFPLRLRNILNQLCKNKDIPSIAFDVSVCSSKLLILSLKIILEYNVILKILYSEAGVYHPTKEEYTKKPENWKKEDGFGLAKGVQKIIPSSEHPGNRRDQLPESIIVFPTFKPERAKAVIADIDGSLITKPKDRVVWIVGDPHLPADSWRVQALKEINQISESTTCYKVSTFDYKKTVECLESIYKPRECDYHINICPLGSKMQAVGIVLFCYVHQDISVVFAVPEEYNASEYTEDCKATWMIDFGSTKKLRDLLDSVGQLSIL